MRHGRPPQDPDSFRAAFALGLRWLAARELSEGQIRDRLQRRGYTKAAIDPAIEHLHQERALDDRRAALAVARTEANVRRRGPRRIMARLVAMRIDRDLAQDVVHELFGETGESDLLQRTLEARLRGNVSRLQDPAERRKLIAYLVRQGFGMSAVSALIRQKSREK